MKLVVNEVQQEDNFTAIVYRYTDYEVWYKIQLIFQRIETINHMKQRGSNLYGDEDYLINSLDPKLVTCYKTVKSQVNFNETR